MFTNPTRAVPLRWVSGFAAMVTACLGVGPVASAGTILIPAGSAWKYLDDGSDQGAAWRAAGFDDGDWASGPAELGYGDGDEATVVNYGPRADNKHITTYFRPDFTLSNLGDISGLLLRVKCDDGAIVYLNGNEVLRVNMPDGPITHETRALSAVDGDAEAVWVESYIDPAQAAFFFFFSINLAVEVHQVAPDDPDLSFDLELVATYGVTRGPYLQQGSHDGVVVRWRTAVETDSQVRCGTNRDDLAITVVDETLTTEHEIAVTGLVADARHYYTVGTSTEVLAGGHVNSFVDTPPIPGTAKPTRVWVLGDSGTADISAQRVRDAYYGFTGSRKTDLWLMLGDNAYTNGSDGDYKVAVFNMYPKTLRNVVLWPTLGNHDARSASSATQSGPYFDIFTLPTAGEAGGLASGTEAYYAFDYGNIHFICLDSSGSGRGPTSPMITWLEADLAATDQDWIVAFWHHPPYSKGSHDSDSEGSLIEMRSAAVPVLEAGGVDLVLSGHSHSYERSFLIDGHYGTSDTLTPAMILDGGDGRADGDGAYEKPTAGPAAHEGTVYAVAGSSGKTSGGSLNHPVMYLSLNVLGSMVLDFDGLRLDAVFLDSTGATRDHFTLRKGIGPRFIRIVGAPDDDPSTYIWPKSDAVGVDVIEIELDRPATLVDSRVTTTAGGAGISVASLTHLGNGVHRVALSGPIPVGHWTQIVLTVADSGGTDSTFEFYIGHLPGDVTADGQFTMSDFTAFGTQFYGDGPRDRIDIDHNGQANLADATLMGQLWHGTSGHAPWQGASLPAKP